MEGPLSGAESRPGEESSAGEAESKVGAGEAESKAGAGEAESKAGAGDAESKAGAGEAESKESAGEAGRIVAWVAHPAQQRPQDAALAAMIVLLSAYAILVSFASALLAVIGVAILVLAIAPFWAPTSYILDATGVRVRRLLVTRARPWGELRRLEVGSRAAFVSPYRQRRFLDRYRGILVLLPTGEQRTSAVETLRERVVVPPT